MLDALCWLLGMRSTCEELRARPVKAFQGAVQRSCCARPGRIMSEGEAGGAAGGADGGARRCAQLIWRFDYAGIVVLIVTSFVPPVYYGFLCEAVLRNFYLLSTLLLGARPSRLRRTALWRRPGAARCPASGLMPG